MAISRMQEPQQIQGGLGSLQDPRQNYGLGKLVKKAFRGVKKIAKSPLGKAALIGGGLWASNAFGPGAGWFGKMTGGKGWAGIGGLLKTGAGKAWAAAKANPWKAGFLGLGAAATALPFLMGKDDEEDVVEEAWDQVPSSVANIRNQAQNYYRDPTGSSLAFMPNKQFVNPNYYAADGGRVGLLNGGEAGQEQIEQMLMAEYVKYKNQGGTLTFEQFVQAIMQQQQEEQMPEGAGMEQPQEVAMAANGGRIGYGLGSWVKGKLGLSKKEARAEASPHRQVGNISDDQLRSRALDIFKNKFSDDDDEDVQYAAHGGRIGYAGGQLVSPNADGTRPGYAGDNPSIIEIIKAFPSAVSQIFSGETGAFLGDDQEKINEILLEKGYGIDLPSDTISMIIDMNKKGLDVATISSLTGTDEDTVTTMIERLNMKADGGRIGALNGGLMIEDDDEYNYNPQAAMRMYRRPGKQEGGIMETEEASEMIDMGGQEKDYRETGGFVEIGGKERADDVPARLSKNEFVFTADAVRAAGGGDIDAGSEVMQNMMDNLEQGGEISEESQGLEGAQAMYDQQQMLQSRIA